MHAPVSPLTRSELQAIAPARLHSYRHGRYQGQEERVYLRDFSPEDRQLLAQIYGTLLDLHRELKPLHEGNRDCRNVLLAYAKTSAIQTVIAQVAQLGHATAGLKSPVDVERLVHDLRGGAFQALAFKLQLFQITPEKEHSLGNIYFLVRDHLKIMRNCVADLDPERFEADSRGLDHSVDLLIEKWSQQDFRATKTPVTVVLDCQFTGTLCESCLEFSSLDRVIYNLMNNAARFTTDGLIHFYVLPVPGPDGDDIRFIVVNRVSEEHRELLKKQFPNDLGELFRGGFTTDGHGVGTRLCADFCAHAYGVFDFTKAKKAGYFGARWVGDYLTAWFHWPRVAR